MPSGKPAQPLITDNLDGTVTVQYAPTEAGLHEMHIKYNGTHIPGERRASPPAVHEQNCSLALGACPYERGVTPWFVSESPLQFYVNHASSPNVTAYGPGLSYGVANKLATFTVFTDEASEGASAIGRTKIQIMVL